MESMKNFEGFRIKCANNCKKKSQVKLDFQCLGFIPEFQNESIFKYSSFNSKNILNI